uniref:Uncharacterized protein n=1 Tax=uncultured prokaryote TaxID=198431 RepID=A0A0H5Q6Z4_9ZZZZ|nr:hypothetical protein [uncultured prokaryote]
MNEMVPLVKGFFLKKAVTCVKTPKVNGERMTVKRCSIHWKASGAIAVNVVDLVFSGFEQSALDDFRDTIVDELKPRVQEDWDLEKVVMLGDQPKVAAGSDVGGLTGGLCSPNVCWLVHKRPGSGRLGRMYLPGVTEAVVDGNGDITGTTVSAMNAALDDWVTAMSTASLQLSMRGSEDIGDLISELRVDTKVATQRRRLRR